MKCEHYWWNNLSETYSGTRNRYFVRCLNEKKLSFPNMCDSIKGLLLVHFMKTKFKTQQISAKYRLSRSHDRHIATVWSENSYTSSSRSSFFLLFLELSAGSRISPGGLVFRVCLGIQYLTDLLFYVYPGKILTSIIYSSHKYYRGLSYALRYLNQIHNCTRGKYPSKE